MSSPVITLDQCNFITLSLDYPIKNFDCGNKDLNDFLINDAKAHIKELMATTYLFEYKNETVSFFSLSNDRLCHEDQIASHSGLKKIKKLIPEQKRYRSLPAVKIGRLGVHKNFKSIGIGTQMLLFLKYWFTHGNKTGCRFLSIDAYNKEDVISFYKKNGFEILSAKDEKEQTRLMYYDLIRFIRDESSA
ncbi:MAG: GNAT family N-acetyltransferase [Chitinispirillaceae bacterium]|nr:GNAT family N-acetyltransferase [Chitinispirillaceae bacterium]